MFIAWCNEVQCLFRSRWFPYSPFKKLKYALVKPLTVIYNKLLSVAEIPADLKKAVIVPVFKKGTTVAISIKSILSKIAYYERILAAKIIDHLHANNLIS